MRKNNFLLYIIGLLTLFGCQHERFDDLNVKPIEVKEGDRVKIDFSLVTSDFNTVSTRMSTEEENQWDIVWVAQFDANGDLVAPPQSYTRSVSQIDITAAAGENTLYFVTNVNENPFVNKQGQVVANMEELKESMYTINQPTYFDTAKKIVMVGVWKGEVIKGTEQPGDNTTLTLSEIIVYAKRLTSKISIIVEATLPNITFQNKVIRIEKIQLCAVPLKASYMQGSKVMSGDDLSEFEEQVFTAPSDGGFTYTPAPYYVLENMHGVVANDKGAPMKGNFAPKDGDGNVLATYVKIRGYIDDGVNAGHVDYRVYLGKDADKSFDIERNFHYTITIKIQGRGPEDITTDVRIESVDDLYQLQLQSPNGGKATNRTSETRNIAAEKTFWGWDGPSTSSSTDHLKVYTNGADWTLDTIFFATAPVNNAYVWDNLHLEYNTSGDTWHKVVKGDPVPGEAKIRLWTGANNSSFDRTATFWLKLHNVPGSVTREWKVRQYKGASAFNMPPYSFVQGKAGVYAVAVRSAGTTTWKFDSKTEGDNVLKFIGTVGASGFSDNPDTWQTGHGNVLFEVRARGNLTSSSAYRALGTVRMAHKSSAEASETSTAQTLVYQIPTAEQLLATKGATSGRRFAYDYSSDALFTTIVGFNGSLPWSLNMLDGVGTEYDDDKGLVGTTSPVNGKANTLQIYNKMDKKAGESLAAVPANYNVIGTPIFTPAGICMAMNENYWEINTENDLNFEWYLPSRNESLMDVFISMLGLNNAGNGINRATIWSSTVNPSTTKENSAYFAGANVDISAFFSVTSNVRAIRRKTGSDVPALSYPYLRNENNTPVIVVRENGKGFVDSYRVKPTDPYDRYYRIDYPDRFTYFDYDPAPDGKGPVGTLELTMSPKFQVAKKDATATPVIWYIAAGWKGDMDFKDIAETGCQSYVEIGDDGTVYDDWRLPTEMELRLIGLLGAGTSQGAGQQYILQKGGDNFTDISGYSLMNGNYWTGTEYISAKEKDLRANYVTIYDLKDRDSPIRGTAINRTENSYKVRCVRDIKD